MVKTRRFPTPPNKRHENKKHKENTMRNHFRNSDSKRFYMDFSSL